MVDKVSIPKMDGNITGLYALKDFVKSQQPVLKTELVEEYAGVLEDYIKNHEASIGGLPYSIWKKASEHSKILEPTLRINLRKGNFNNYWIDLFNISIEKTMPEWIDLFEEDIGAVYNGLNSIINLNSGFLKNFDVKKSVAEMGTSKKLNIMSNHLVDETVYSKYLRNMPYALGNYNTAVNTFAAHMDEIDISLESKEEAADVLNGLIAESNKVLGVIGDSEDRKDILQGALLLEEYLDETQRNLNVCLTNRDIAFKFNDSYMITLNTGSIMSMLFWLKNINLKWQEFKPRALEHLGYELEGFDAEAPNPYASSKVAVRKNKND